MAASIKASAEGLKLVDNARTLRGWNKHSTEWADLAKVSLATLKRFWRQLAISTEAFVDICNAAGVAWQDVAEFTGSEPRESHEYQALLRTSVTEWNRWKKDVARPIIDLENSNLSSADLRNADLRYVSLKNTNLRGATLTSANLCEADLTQADFSGAILTGANLSKSVALGTIFDGATLTGACIEDWNINADTSLEGVICTYIFQISKAGQFTGRLPIDPNSKFAPGEFTQRFNILSSARETIDLTFTEGINWQAFFQTFQELRRENQSTEISIQGIEAKDEAFIVRLLVHAEANKGNIETQAKQLYTTRLALLETKYREQLRIQGKQLEEARKTIQAERKDKANLMDILKKLADH